MAKPQTGQPFTDFELDTLSTRSLRSSGPLFLVVWRTDCPTCRLTMPFVDRLHRFYRAANVVGIVQNQPDEVTEYASANGLTMPNYADSTLKISSLLGVDTVPSFWVISKNGLVLLGAEAWDRNKLEEAGRVLSVEASSTYVPLITAADQVPVFKPG